jgi:uncharacterized membrane protein YjfL (UPF0719 family)
VSPVGLILHTLMILAVGLALFGLGHLLLKLLLRPARLRVELFEKDNTAVGVAVAGYHLGLVLSFGSVLMGESRGWAADLVQMLGYGVLAVTLYATCGTVARGVAIGRLGLVRELTADRNLGLGYVLAGYLLASGLIIHGLLAGQGGGWMTIPVFFVLGQAVLLAVGLVYGRIVGYHLREELARDNAAAGLAYGGCLVAMGLILGEVVGGDFVSWRESLLGFAIYALGGLIALPVIRWLVDLILAPGVHLSREIAAEGAVPNLVAGMLEASSYIAAGLLVAWGMS